jgi:hypothetical protein
MYRGYTAYVDPATRAPWPRNLTQAQHDEKVRIMGVYNGGPITPGDIYDEWCWRYYPVDTITGGPGPLKNNGGPCLQPSGSQDGAPLQLATCNGSAAQTWTSGGDSRVVGLGGKCMGVGNDGTTIVLETCTGGADQKWTWMTSGQIHGSRDQCLSVYADQVQTENCQAWNDNANPPFYFSPSIQQWGF